MFVLVIGVLLIGLPGLFCLYSQTVIMIVLTSTNKPPSIDMMLSCSLSQITAIGSAKKAIRKLDNATWIASKFLSALKNRIIDKKLWKIVSSEIPIQVLAVKLEISLKTFSS